MRLIIGWILCAIIALGMATNCGHGKELYAKDVILVVALAPLVIPIGVLFCMNKLMFTDALQGKCIFNCGGSNE